MAFNIGPFRRIVGLNLGGGYILSAIQNGGLAPANDGSLIYRSGKFDNFPGYPTDWDGGGLFTGGGIPNADPPTGNIFFEHFYVTESYNAEDDETVWFARFVFPSEVPAIPWSISLVDPVTNESSYPTVFNSGDFDDPSGVFMTWVGCPPIHIPVGDHKVLITFP